MRRILMTLVCVAVLMAHTAQAASGKLYLSGNAGLLISDDMDLPGLNIDFSPGWNAVGAIGFVFEELRVEGEIGYHTADIDKANDVPVSGADLTALSYMINLYYDFDWGKSFFPYLGFGMGIADTDLDFTGSTRGSDTTYAYQFIMGVGYEITSSFFLTGGYRYFIISKEESPEFHEFNLGARIIF